MPYFTDRGMTRWSLSPVLDNFMGVVSETEYMRKLTVFLDHQNCGTAFVMTDIFLEELGH